MGAFFIKGNNEQQSEEAIAAFFLKKGHTSYQRFDTANASVFLFEKIKKREANYIIAGEHKIAATGTFNYKQKNYKQSLELLISDYKNNTIDYDSLNGHYNIFLLNSSDKIQVLSDAKNSLEIYTNTSNTLFSNSFLALAELSTQKLTLNKNAIAENLLTGCLFGNETIFNEIQVYSGTENKFLQPVTLAYKTENTRIKNRSEAVEYQLANLNSYFKSFEALVNENGAEIGLSGGYDSRLMLSLCNAHYAKNLQLHTHWKAKNDLDITIAKQLATTVKKELKILPILQTKDMDSAQLENTLQESLFFYDGLTRVNHGWTRKYRTLEYRNSVLGNINLGMSGLGGELYRNDFHINFSKIALSTWISNFILPIYLTDKIPSSTTDLIVQQISKKINTQLGLGENNKYLSKKDVYRYYGEMWVKKGPGIRNSIENQLSYFISPFTDSKLMQQSYNTVEHLGISGEFEAALIMSVNPALGKIISGYGFSFDKIPASHLLKHTAISYIPVSLKQKLIKLMIGNKHTFPALNKSLMDNHEVIRNCINEIKKLNLGFDIEKLLMYQDEFDRIVGTGYLISYLEKKHQYEIK